MSRLLRITLTTGLVLTLGIASILGAYSIVNAAADGPDAYGYYYIDSNEGGGPTYGWVEISGTGTATGLGDDDCVFAPIGFTFDFYGVSYNNVNISSNGLLNFGTCWWDALNQLLPYAAQPEPIIAAFWDDLSPATGGEVYYETFGTTPNQTFVVEWQNVPQWLATGAGTLEVILYEGTNEIIMQYADTDFGNATFDWGQSATVGIQQNGTNALQYSNNQAVITNPLAILFTLTPPSPNTPPDIPTLNSPSDGATDVVLTPDLVFNYSDPDTDDCTSFDLQVDDDAGFGSLDIDDSVGGTWSSGSPITYTVSSPLAPGTQYFWRVNVFDGTDWSGWSDGSWDFTTIPPNNPPNIPTLNSPSDGATDVVLTPDLVFNYSDPDTDDCTSFDIRVDDDPGFGSLDIDDSVGGTWSSGSSITYTVSTPLAPGTLYYWRVDVSDGTDWSGWSDGSWDFTTVVQSGGSVSDTYYPNEDVTVSGTGFPPDSDVHVYVVYDGTWLGGEPIGSDVGDGMDIIHTDPVDGSITPTIIWTHPLTIGEYDIVFDADRNGDYDVIPDVVDDPNHPGFTVTAAPPPRRTVGGEVYPVDKTALLLPWLISGAVLILAAGGLILIRRRS